MVSSGQSSTTKAPAVAPTLYEFQPPVGTPYGLEVTTIEDFHADRGDWTASAVAAHLGFSDAADFGRFFRTRTGLTPAAYAARKMRQETDSGPEDGSGEQSER